MVVGIYFVQLYMPENCSLKDKRQIVKSIKERVRNKFHITVAEVGNLELWQRATISMAYISTDKEDVEALFHKIVNFIDSLGKAEILDQYFEMLPYHLDD